MWQWIAWRALSFIALSMCCVRALWHGGYSVHDGNEAGDTGEILVVPEFEFPLWDADPPRVGRDRSSAVAPKQTLAWPQDRRDRGGKWTFQPVSQMTPLGYKRTP